MAEAADRQAQFIGINGYSPREPFVRFHNRPERWAVMVIHRRGGKTVACIADLVLSALVTTRPDARFAYIAPQFNQAKDIAWTYLKRLTSDIPGVSYNETELRCDLPNGSRIRLYGADNPDRLRGLYLDGVILDEYADMKPRVWGEVVRPLLSDRSGWAAFIGTPKGKNEFWELWDGSKKDQDWFRLMLKASESGLIDKYELEDARRSMTDDQYEQEFECSFEAAITGAFYGKELRELDKKGRITAVEYARELPVHTAWDLGYSDDTAIWFYQVLRGGTINVIDYYANHGKDVQHYCDMLKDKPYAYGWHWVPHDAAPETLAANGRSIVQQAQSHGIEMYLCPNLGVQDGIQAARITIPRCWFDAERCDEGLEALRQYQREWDEDKKRFKDKPRHDWTSHAADAFRYLSLVWKEPPPDKARPNPPKGMTVGNNQVTLNELLKSNDRKQDRRRRI